MTQRLVALKFYKDATAPEAKRYSAFDSLPHKPTTEEWREKKLVLPRHRYGIWTQVVGVPL